MYPSVIIAFNIAPNCMIGKLIIEDIREMPKYNYKEPPSDKDKKKSDNNASRYDAGQDFVDNLLAGNIALLGSTWFNLPDYETIRKEFQKRFGVNPRIKIILDYKNKFKEEVRI